LRKTFNENASVILGLATMVLLSAPWFFIHWLDGLRPDMILAIPIGGYAVGGFAGLIWQAAFAKHEKADNWLPISISPLRTVGGDRIGKTPSGRDVVLNETDYRRLKR
jgi:4-amino-4-deoxy-L-arabinose transferase-like glycosyltransferase